MKSRDAQVIGLGVVGGSTAYFLSKIAKRRVVGYDMIPKRLAFVKTLKRPSTEADLNFICVNELMVRSTVRDMVEQGVDGLYVIRSTTPPGTTMSLMKKYKRHICHNPEFLREDHARWDAIHPSRVVIGQCCEKHGAQLKKLYAPTGAPIYITDPTTSELAKLTVNVIRATMISFWNEIHTLAKQSGVDTAELAKLVDARKTLFYYEGGKWGTKFYGKKFGGKCLPKDLDHMLQLFLENELQPVLLEAVKGRNRIAEGNN